MRGREDPPLHRGRLSGPTPMTPRSSAGAPSRGSGGAAAARARTRPPRRRRRRSSSPAGRRGAAAARRRARSRSRRRPGRRSCSGPLLAQLVVERAREADLAELRGAVDGLVREAAPPGLGGERDDVALAARACAAAPRARRRASLQVDVDHLVEVLPRELEERPVGADAGVRDEDVDAAEPLGGRVRAPRAPPGRARRTAARRRRRGRGRRRSRQARPSLTPRACSSRATAAPMPRLAPVMTAVFPSRLMSPPEVEVPGRERGSARSSRVGRRPRRVGLDPLRAPARSARRPRATSAKTPARTPASSAAPNAEPASHSVRSSGRPSTEATISSQRALREPPPEIRPTSGLDAELAQELERVPQPVGDALQHRAGERPAVVPQLEARRRRRARPDRRAACARRRGTARTGGLRCRPASARPPRVERCRLGPEHARAATANEPPPESITPIACQVPGTAWQKVCTRASASGAYAGSTAKTTPRSRAPPTPARAGRCRRRARRQPGRRPPPSSVDSSAGGSHSRGISSASHTSSDQRRRADVEEQRPRGVRDVGRVLAGQPEVDVVLRQQHPPDARVGLRLVAPQPEQLRRGEARRAPGCRSARSAARARSRSSISAHSAAVRPSFQRIAGRITRSSSSSTTRPCICPESPIRPGRDARASAACAARHQSSGSCSAQPGRGVESG